MNLSGTPFDYLIAFGGGILVSFTPCVYPLIPVSAAYIGVNSSGSRLKGLTLSVSYVTGLALTYSFLGILAALTGSFFGRIQTHPVTLIIVGCIFILFGLSMVGMFQLRLPHLVSMRQHKKHSHLSTFFLGISSGFMASPCLTPVLGSILVYLTAQRNVIYGATLLFTFAYGMGFMLILIGTFSSVLLSLPKAGEWLNVIKRIFGWALIGTGVFCIIKAIGRF
jgi:cytochrome c-type biogenesis protein